MPTGRRRTPCRAFEPGGSILALGLAGTGLAAIIYYSMLSRFGSLRTGFVTYLLPVAALIYGVLLLDEPLAWSALVGLVLILLGVALGSDLVALRRQAAIPISPSAKPSDPRQR
ncbi:MAG: EamA family transporter [Acidobacteria bacterium]|nr:EamA family transporter [Acidobacteriota bacterium]